MEGVGVDLGFYEKRWEAGESVAVHQSHSPAMGRARVKSPAQEKSRPAVREYNRKRARWECTNIMNANFIPGDYHGRLHHRADAKPDPETAMRRWKKFCEAMRAACRTAGIEFKYIHALGMGERGAIHHHVAINREARPLAEALWHHGRAHFDPMYDKRGDRGVPMRNFQKLAFYFCGQDKGENPDDRKQWLICGKGYSCSKNLLRPQADRAFVQDEEMPKYPKPDEGYIIDAESLDVGENPVTGKLYLYYIMLPMRLAPGVKAAERERWEKQLAALNAADVRFVMDEKYGELEERKKQWAARESSLS